MQCSCRKNARFAQTHRLINRFFQHAPWNTTLSFDSTNIALPVSSFDYSSHLTPCYWTTQSFWCWIYSLCKDKEIEITILYFPLHFLATLGTPLREWTEIAFISLTTIIHIYSQWRYIVKCFWFRLKWNLL